jgi:hypothetical protein
MEQLREYRYLIATIIAIFALLLIGAFFSPSFSEQMTYLELFILAGSLLFVFSILVVAAVLGFSSFALYMAVFLAIVIAMYGWEGALLVIFLSYITWGLVFSIELLLVDNEVESAIEWFEKRYDFQSFRREYYLFLPMSYLLYVLVEVLPGILYRERFSRFSPQKVYDKMQGILK